MEEPTEAPSKDRRDIIKGAAPAADTFTIHLNRSVGKKTKVAWFLLG